MRLIGPVLLSNAVLLAGCAAPGSADLVKAGITEFQLGQLDKAKATLERVLDQEPSHAEALFCLARIHHAQRAFERAVYYYQCCLDADPGYPDVAKHLAEAQREAGKTGKLLRFIPDLSE